MVRAFSLVFSLVLSLMAAITTVRAADAPSIMVIGDSQAQGVAGAMQRLYLRSRDFHIIDKSKIATGLNSRSTYDWPATVEQLATSEHAAVAIVMFGANDRPPIRVKGVVDDALADKFDKAYGAHVSSIVKSLRAAKIDVIWLGHPIVKDADYAADMQFLNHIMQTASVAEGAEFVPLWDIGSGTPDLYDAYGKGLDGQTKRLRADDGVHFTPAGYDLIAAKLDPMLKAMIAAKPTMPVAAAPTPTQASAVPGAPVSGGPISADKTVSQ